MRRSKESRVDWHASSFDASRYTNVLKASSAFFFHSSAALLIALGSSNISAFQLLLPAPPCCSRASCLGLLCFTAEGPRSIPRVRHLGTCSRPKQSLQIGTAGRPALRALALKTTARWPEPLLSLA